MRAELLPGSLPELLPELLPGLAGLGPGAVLGLLLLGAWLALDQAAFGQFMLARPLVAAIVGGWVAGDPAMGALVGVLLEALHLGHLPAGGARLPDPGPGSLVAGAVAAGATPVSADANGGMLALALLVGIGLSLAGGRLVTAHRWSNGRRVQAALEGGRPLGRVLVGALLRGGARGVGLVATGLVLATLAPADVVARWPFGVAATAGLVAMAAFLGLGSVARTPVPARPRSAMLLLGGVAAGVAAGLAFGLLAGAEVAP